MMLFHPIMTSYQNLAIIIILIWLFKHSETKAQPSVEYDKSYITHIPLRHKHHIPAFYQLSLHHLAPANILHFRQGTVHRHSKLKNHEDTTTVSNPTSALYYPEWSSHLPYKSSIINVNEKAYQDNFDLSPLPYKYKSQDTFLSRMDKIYSCPNK